MYKDRFEMEQELVQLLNDGFFDDIEFKTCVDKDGKLDFKGLSNLWIGLGGRKYTLKYLLKYGKLGPAWVQYDNRDEDEEKYKELIESNKTWEEAFGKPPKDVLL